MTNISEFVDIIMENGGSASFDEIIEGYKIRHHMIIFPEHKAIMLQTLKSNPNIVSYNSDECTWKLIPSYSQSTTHTSQLSRVVTATAFEKAYRHFIEQANKNAVTKKAQGQKVPFGFSTRPYCDGAHFKPQYGQGAASVAPYMNWWVVSVYYMPDNGKIVIGIEEDRYPHINEISIKPLVYSEIGNKKVKTLVYYSSTVNDVDYQELYDKFIQLCEEVIRLGLS